jgi:BMFP domain-containing protein YqiC
VSDVLSQTLFKLDAIEARLAAMEAKYGKLVVVPKPV